MADSRKDSILDTDKRVRLGLWGLGRGMSFYKACAALNIDVVAGCDYNEHMRDRFLEANSDAFATDDEDVFLSGDFDAVLLATFCPSHGPDAVKCLEAGKHVLSEVTAFHTMAEGVRLVEAVERSGLVYNLAENYPFTAPQLYIARRWKEGLFGDLMYAEGEYVHEVRSLAYTYIDGKPIEPGHVLHNWRSWLNFHYYCTHSLGPVMHITGLRPSRVVSLPGAHALPGYPEGKGGGLGSVTPSLINMSNGAVFKNLMGGTTNDSHQFRYWGTRGAAEVNNGLFLRLGGSGGSPRMAVRPEPDELMVRASGMGHGGGDFFVLYYFARQILFGDPAPFDIYVAADCTTPGILAFRSAREGGKIYDVPDFRNNEEREHWRHDDRAQPHFDPDKGCFPARADSALTGQFDGLMAQLIGYAHVYKAYADWAVVMDDLEDPAQVLSLADRLVESYPGMRDAMDRARALADAYPRSQGARLLREVLEMADAPRAAKADFLDELKKERTRLRRKLRRRAAR